MGTLTRRNGDGTLSGAYALLLVETARQWRVTPDQLLGPLGLAESSLADPNATLSLHTCGKLVDRARALTGEPGLGLQIGLRMRPSSHGLVGLAAMTAPTVRAALELAARFAPTRSSALALELVVDGSRAFVIVDELASLGGAQDTILLALAAGTWQLLTTLTGRSFDGQVELAFPEPAYWARLRHLVPFTARFGMTRHRLSFDAALLDVPLLTADLAAERLLAQLLERELHAVAKLERVSARVRHLLVRSNGGFRTLDEVAAALHVSPRTLRRQLAVEQASFSDLLEEERRERALVLLRGSTHTLEEITEQLGYSDVANFARAFRRWTGQTPGTFRRGSI